MAEPTAPEPKKDGPQRFAPPSLLTNLLSDPLDPGYLAAAERPRKRGPVRLAVVLVGCLTIGTVIGVAVGTTSAQAPDTAQVRTALVADVEHAQRRGEELEETARSLAAELRAAQRALSDTGARDQLQTLEELNGLLAVEGPGLRVVITDPGAPAGAGAVLDRDLQELVNGLWAAGAEAVSVGGVRLRVTSAVRQAGSAILVDNRPVSWPLEVLAVGDPALMHPRFAGTVAFTRFSAFVQLYDIGFEVTVADHLELPAAAAVDAHYIRPTD